MAEFAVVYGYWPCYSEQDQLVVLQPGGEVDDPAAEACRFAFPRQRRPRYLCLADFFRDRELARAKGPDVVAFHLVTMGSAVSQATARLFEQNAYRDYLELHGLSVQLTEALAEMWHARIRSDLGFAADDGKIDDMIRDQAYRGSRYSFGYPACPDLEDRAKLVALLRPGADRRRAVRGAAAPSRAIHRRSRGPPPRGEVLQRPLARLLTLTSARLWPIGHSCADVSARMRP